MRIEEASARRLTMALQSDLASKKAVLVDEEVYVY